MAWSCPKDAQWRENQICYEMDPNWKEEKRPKTTWGRTVMKELEAKLGLTRGKAQAKDQNRED